MCINRRPKNRWNGAKLSPGTDRSWESDSENTNEHEALPTPSPKKSSVEAESAKLHQVRWRKRVAPSPPSPCEQSSRWRGDEQLKSNQGGLDTDSDQEMSSTPSMLLTWHNLTAYGVEKMSSSPEDKNSSPESDVEANMEKPRKKVLNNVFGTARPGEVLAIMGSSGAGKTSLLNTLTQRNTGTLEVEGSIQVNGEPADGEYMKKVSAYVQQDDLFFGSLTVKEHLMFNARLRMSDTMSMKEKEERVERIMTQLGLRDVANSPIGTTMKRGISGGQRKRVAFAAEILTSPPILFCDEPTSGLDSFLAFQVVSVLKKLAMQKGMTVVLTIHQPSSQVFELFDRIYLMAEGRVAFCGSQSEASSMFDVIGSPLPTNFNPADHYISTLAVKENREKSQIDKIGEICDHFEESSLGKELARDAAPRDDGQSDSGSNDKEREKKNNHRLAKYRASWFRELQALAIRNFRISLRDPLFLTIHVAKAVFIAVICGIVLSGSSIAQNKIMDVNGMLYQMVFHMSNLMPFEAIHNCMEEFPLYHREHSSNLYRISSYFLAKNLSELPFSCFTGIIFSAILYVLAAVHPFSLSSLMFILVAIIVQNVVISIAYAVSFTFSTTSGGVYAFRTSTFALEAVAGLLINVADIPIYFAPFSLLSYFRYAFEALVINEWKDVEHIPGNCTRPSGCPTNGDDVINSLSFNKEMMWPNVGIMIFILFVIRLIAFGGLCFKTKSKK